MGGGGELISQDTSLFFKDNLVEILLIFQNTFIVSEQGLFIKSKNIRISKRFSVIDVVCWRRRLGRVLHFQFFENCYYILLPQKRKRPSVRLNWMTYAFNLLRIRTHGGILTGLH